jgi:peroxiredoxin family protein
MSEAEKEKAAIIVFSGDMDRVMAAFIIATTAAASGIDTTMFFTFWGLKAIQKGNLTGKGFLGKMLGLLNRGGIDRLSPSRLNFGGLGRLLFRKMMRDKRVASLAELRQLAIQLGVKLLACQTSMEVMEIRREDLIDEVAGVAGAATFVATASRSHITLFI